MSLVRHGLVLVPLVALLSCGSSTAPDDPNPVAIVPPASAGHVLVYHDALQSVVLVNAGLGGMASPPSTARTVLWRWDGQAWSVLDSLGPPVRNLGGVAYDSHRDRLVLHGGSYSADLVYDETWEWSPASGWVRRSTGGPGRRDHTEMVYDPERRSVVLFGGQVTPGSLAAGTWTWDGTTWQAISGASPPLRYHHAMVYDPAGRRTVLFGGVTLSGAAGDTWAWDGTSWTTAATSIAPRTHARAGLTSGGVIVYGGFPAASGMLALNGSLWSEVSGSNPGPRYLTAMAYDPMRQVTVLFGGGNPSTDQLYADTWEYVVATGWRRVSP